MKQTFANYNIIICGTGATGSHLIPFMTQLLAFEKKAKVTFIDGDKVETKNLRNQKFLKKDDGLPKSRVLQKRYAKIYPELDLSFVNKYIEEASQIRGLLDTKDSTLNILVGCVDNNPTRKIFTEVFDTAHNLNLLYIDSGNGTTTMQGQVVVGYRVNNFYVYDNRSNLIECLSEVISPCSGHIFKEILEDTDTVDHVTSCAYVGDKNPQNIATNIMAASTVFNIINQVISFDNIQTGMVFFDARNHEVNYRPVAMQKFDWDLEIGFTSNTDFGEECSLDEDNYNTLNEIYFSFKNHDTLVIHNKTFEVSKCSFSIDCHEYNPISSYSRGKSLIFNMVANIVKMEYESKYYSFDINVLAPYLKDIVFDAIAPQSIRDLDENEEATDFIIDDPRVTHIIGSANYGNSSSEIEYLVDNVDVYQYTSDGHTIKFKDGKVLM